jgi:Ca2+-binding EF-hand superfamily protein
MLQCDGVIELNLTKISHEHLRETFDIFCDRRCSFSQNTFDVYDVLRIFNLLGEEPTLDEIEDIFDEIDVHNHGFISFFTFCLFMMNSGPKYIPPPLQNLEPLNKDPSFTIEPLLSSDFEDEEEIEEKISQDQKIESFQLGIREMETAFELFDASGKGYVSKADIRKVFCCLGEDLSEAEVNTIIKEGDKEGKGYIDFRDFQRLMNTPDFICTYDEQEPEEEAISIYDPRQSFSHPKIVEIFEEITIVNLRNYVVPPTLHSVDLSWQNSKEHQRSASCKNAIEHQLSELDKKFTDAQVSQDDSGSDMSSISCSVSLFKAGKRHSSMFEQESINDLLAETNYY